MADLPDDQRGDREVVAAQAEGGQADGEGHEHRDADADEHAEPGGDVVIRIQEAGAVGADPEVDRLAERDLAAVAGEHVPALRHQRVDEHHHQHVALVGRIEYVRPGDERGAGECEPHPLLRRQGRADGLGPIALELRARLAGRWRVRRSRHQNRPNSPLGRTITMARYIAKMMAYL